MAEDRDSGKLRQTRDKRSPLIKYLLVAVFVLAIAVPVYWYSWESEVTLVSQSLELLPSRSGGSDIIYLEKSGNVEISFYVYDNFKSNADLVITNIAGDTVLYNPGISKFNAKGVGSITLPVSMFNDNHYILTIRPEPETGLSDRIYMFRAK